MDTLKHVIQKDTIFSTNNKTVEKTTIETIKYRDNTDSCDIFCNCPIISDLIWPLTVLTIVFLFYKKIKNLFDNIGERIKSGDNVSFGTSGIEINKPRKLSDKEVNERTERKFETEEFKAKTEIRTEEKKEHKDKTPLDKREFVSKYLRLEKKFFDMLMKFFYPQFKVLSNRRLGVFEYDIILESATPDNLDYIFEVKYFPQGYDKSRLQDSILRLGQSTRYYINSTNRQAKPLLVNVVQRGDFSERQFEELRKFTSSTFYEFPGIPILTVHFDEFDQLTKENIIELMKYEP